MGRLQRGCACTYERTRGRLERVGGEVQAARASGRLQYQPTPDGGRKINGERERVRQRDRERERAVRVGDRVWNEKFISSSIAGRRVRGFACVGAPSIRINYISQLSP